MLILTILAAVALILLALVCYAAAGSDLYEGKWLTFFLKAEAGRALLDLAIDVLKTFAK